MKISSKGLKLTPYSWKDFSRFVDVAPVQQGWLVTWGRFHNQGAQRELAGNRTYANLQGARRRVADAALELTRDPALAEEALAQFDRTRFRRSF